MRRSWLLALCGLLAPLASFAAAGGVVNAYVPLATNLPLGAARYRTLLIATNTGGSPASLGVAFLAGGTDGGTVPPQPASFAIPPGSTLRLYDSVPAGARGLFELSGPPEIVVSARVEALAANGNLLASAEVPVVSAGGAIAAGQHVELLGLEQSAGGAGSDFGLLNLGASPAHCTVTAYRADGSRITNPVNLTIFARSAADFTGALPRLGQTAIKDTRFDVTCDQMFGTYALVYRSGGPETVVLGPAARMDGTLTPDDDGSFHFDLPGQFADGTTYAAYDLPIGDGVQYGRARVEFDLYLNRWHPPFPGNPNYETVASFRRSATKRPDRILYWGLILKGSGDFRTLLDIGPPPGVTEGTTVKSGKGPWQERTTYHVVLDYDVEAGSLVFEAYQAGQLVQRLTGTPNNSDISNLGNQLVRVDFSAPGVGDGAYFPTTGWLYSNLAVTLTPRRR
ncbi:MAG TPA: hypothetical protein VFE33_24145 [Thermoanaerobaculia bacterium]|nr:hypothetical protein [Thermoanaerobaculia bacterium]